MALSASGTPKNTFTTSKRLAGTNRTPAPGLSEKTPSNTPRSQFATPRTNYATPKSRKASSAMATPECSSNVEAPTRKDKLSNVNVAVKIRPGIAKEQQPPKNQFTTPKTNSATPKSRKASFDTPDCFSNVTVETPTASSKRNSNKDKYDQVSNLTVAIRIRPMGAKELGTNVVKIRDKELIIRTQPSGASGMATDHIFQYDHIFWSCDESDPIYATQEDVFMTLGKPLLNNAFRGYNGCLFAYGQTGSGKSFSMMGRNTCDSIDIDTERYSGVTPRFCKDLFERVRTLDKGWIATVEVSYFEIYNEKIHDLLASSSCVSNRTPLKVREHPIWGPYVVDLSVHTVKTYEELRDWLLQGNKNRATAATSMNEKSSRSHSIFSIELSLCERIKGEDMSRRSKVSLIDLAGSERLGNSHNTEKIREGVYINKSLLTLGKVISALADQKKNQFVPYRDSVLTWLLRESLGGNSLTAMLATISPASTQLEETLATLRYACQARSIVNRARVNESPHDRLVRELRLELENLTSLREEYEKRALSSSSVILINDSTSEDLEQLRNKLTQTENRLLEAQRDWEQRFMETKKTQMKELAEAEKYKAELESTVRVMKTANSDVSLSPYTTNFLEELECVLTDDNAELSDISDDIKNWCNNNDLTCTFTADSMTVTDLVHGKQARLSLGKLDLRGFENIGDFIRNLKWTKAVKPAKKLSKAEVMSSMNRIYQALSHLQPPEDENNLSLLFAKVNKSLQAFETALLNNMRSNTGQKTVTFNM
ncbi:hypothetical protein NQ315_015870 [Exocentrus adspersus]|uniref:Kinesin-like protein n=1 Tax=Exocentrus adspersus TaxID=1586481 RepID=A0AAV8W417_9CUCU|nr:hypothetical protein NQ315_015870 [Exocentrus adspersus]